MGIIESGELSELVEGARLESVYTAKVVSRVRISRSPPFLYERREMERWLSPVESARLEIE